MTLAIIPVRTRVHAFLRRVLCVLKPGTGRRRAGERPTAPASWQEPAEPGTSVSGLPAHRSPYGLHEWLDGEDSALVRPYLLVCEHIMGAEEVPV